MVLGIMLAGCGRFGKKHLRVLKELESEGRIRLIGVLENSEESAKKVSEKYGVSAYSRISKEIISSVDAVDIVSPASSHISLIRKFIPHSHILCEKPVALSMDELKEIKILAEKNKKIFAAGHIFRFSTAVKKIAEIVKKNAENLYHIEGNFSGKAEPQKDCGAVATVMHLFDIINFIFQKEADKLFCKLGHPFNGKFEDCADIILEYPGFSASFFIGWTGEEKKRELIFRFKELDIECNLALNEIKTLKEGKKTVEKLDGKEPLRAEIEAFIDACEGKNTGIPGIEDAMKVQSIIDAAYLSSKTGKMEDVKKWQE